MSVSDFCIALANKDLYCVDVEQEGDMIVSRHGGYALACRESDDPDLAQFLAESWKLHFHLLYGVPL